MKDLIKMDLPMAELAVLSACHSAGVNKETPDESLHPAAGMLFAGFRSVVGTLWAMQDEVGPILAEQLYLRMIRKEEPEIGADAAGAAGAATALRHVVTVLGQKEYRLLQRINFVHFGI